MQQRQPSAGTSCATCRYGFLTNAACLASIRGARIARLTFERCPESLGLDRRKAEAPAPCIPAHLPRIGGT